MQNDVITAETVIKPRRRRPLASTSTNVDIEEGDRLVHGHHADRHRVDEGHVPAGRVKGTSIMPPLSSILYCLCLFLAGIIPFAIHVILNLDCLWTNIIKLFVADTGVPSIS